MEAASPDQPARQWPAPKPDLIHAMIGSVLAAQGLVPTKDGRRNPWGNAEAMAEFDRCAPWIAAALKGSDLTVDDVRDGVRGGWFFPFYAPDGVMIAETILSPRLRALHVLAAGGTLRAINELTPMVEEFARLAGCNYGGASGRRGWVRWLKRLGYSIPKLATVEKAL